MDTTTKREIVPGHVVKVTWWNGKQWWTTYEAHPIPPAVSDDDERNEAP